MHDFVERLDSIEPPGQLVSLLIDPLLQKYVNLNPNLITTTRLHTWLAACLEDLYEGERMHNGDAQYLSEMLGGLLKYAQYTKVTSTLKTSRLSVDVSRHYTRPSSPS